MKERYPEWETIERVSYMGMKKDKLEQLWKERHGKRNWRLAWQLADDQIWDFDQVFFQNFVAGYTNYFKNWTRAELKDFSSAYSFTYDKTPILKSQAFDPHALYQKPGIPNQFHHTALNIALEYYLGYPFTGQFPLQVREGKPGTDPHTWPQGWRLSPGRIPSPRPDLIPENPNLDRVWWQKGSIEELYQNSKILQRRTTIITLEQLEEKMGL